MKQLRGNIFAIFALLLLAVEAHGGEVVSFEASPLHYGNTTEDYYPDVFQRERSILSELTRSNYCIDPPKPKLIVPVKYEPTTSLYTHRYNEALPESRVYISRSASPYFAHAPPCLTL